VCLDCAASVFVQHYKLLYLSMDRIWCDSDATVDTARAVLAVHFHIRSVVEEDIEQ